MHFFLKHVLYVPPRNPLNTYRLLLWFFLGIISVREYYQWALGISNRLGGRAFLALGIILSEALLWMKYGRDMFTEPVPFTVKWSWIAGLCLLTCWFLYHFVHRPAGSRRSLARQTARSPGVSPARMRR